MKSTNKDPAPTNPEELRLIEACKAHGADVWTLYDFVQRNEKFPMNEEIAKILSREVVHVKDKHVKAIVIEAMSWPQFRAIVMPALAKVLRTDGHTLAGQTAANAISRIASKVDAALVAELILDKSVGESRSLMMAKYAQIARKSGICVFRSLVLDPETRSYALKQLSILGDVSIEPELRELAQHPDSYHRKIARDALKRIEKLKLKLPDQIKH
jgi:HEAT repeat protein